MVSNNHWLVYVKMSQSDSESPCSCPGCYPVYQPNQLAHMDPGGCLWCSFEEDNEQLQLEGDFDNLFDEPMILETSETSETSSEKTDNTECCICYETIDKNKNNCTTECGHTFCLKCLITSFSHDNNSCPCCRQELIDLPDEDDEEEEDNDDEEDIEDSEDDEPECPIDELADRLKNKGYNLETVLSMLLGRYRKGETDLAVYELNEKFDTIVEEADTEALEQAAMGLEDMNRLVTV
jgi:hypothetical protein